MAGAPVYIVHLSCNDALKKFAKRGDRGLPAYARRVPQYLYLSLKLRPRFRGREIRLYSGRLREKWNQEKIWQGLAKTLYKSVSTILVLSA